MVAFQSGREREELVRGALQQVDVDGGEQDTVGDGYSLGEVSSHASSPISDAEINNTIRTLKRLVGDSDFLTTAGFRRVLYSREYGLEITQQFRKALKRAMRVDGAVELNELDKDVANGHE